MESANPVPALPKASIDIVNPVCAPVLTALKKLLVGEQVEVRQLDKGLRGSWHFGVVVTVRPGRRIVEYDELLTRDGLKKLRESIPVVRWAEEDRVLSRQPCPSHKETGCGLIRPRAPILPISPTERWSRGLLVDAFYDDAWWEGVLMEDTALSQEDTCVTVFFPDEGDKQQMPLKNLRFSVCWNEATERWTVKGCLILPNLDEGDSLLRIMFFWKQKIRTGKFDTFNKEGDILVSGNIEFIPFEADIILIDGSYTWDKGICLLLNVQQSSMEKHKENPYKNHSRRDGCYPKRGVAGSDDGFALCLKKSVASVASPIQGYAREACENIGGQSPEETILSRHSCPDLPLCQDSQFKPKKKGSFPAAKKAFSDGNQTVHMETVSEMEVGTCIRDDSDKDQTLAECRTELQTHCAYSKHDANIQVRKAGRGITSHIFTKSKDTLEKLRHSYRKRLSVARWNAESCERDGTNGKAHDCFSRATSMLLRKRQNVQLDIINGEALKSGLLNKCDSGEDLDLFDRHLTKSRKVKHSAADGKCKRSSDRGQGGALNTRVTKVEATLAQPLLGGSSTTEPLSGVDDSMLASMVSNSCLVKVENGASNITPCRVSDQEVKGKKNPEDTMVSVKRPKKRKPSVQDHFFSLESKSSKRTSSKLSRSSAEKKGGQGHGGCQMQVLLALPGKYGDASAVQGGVEAPHLKKRTVLSWLIDMGVLMEERVCYVSRKDGHIMKEGRVTREGVVCKCCNSVYTLSNFESHAGSKLHRPSANMFLDDGRSISECQMQAWALQNESENPSSASDNREELNDCSDDTCGVCGDGGELLLCDQCPATFHAECLGLEAIPDGDWFCPSCRCGMCGGSHFSSNDSELHEKNTLLCDQCEREYHISCLASRGTRKVDLHLEKKPCFCGSSCEQIFSCLRRLVGVVIPLENGLSCSLLRCMEEDPGTNVEVAAELNSKLSVALAVMQECFVPMIDPRTKIDIIAQVLYNRRSKVYRLNYFGFYTMLLERDDEIISVATVRIHGSKVAEMPFIGTRFQHRRQGMCRNLMQALQEMLRSIGIKKLVLPAVPELLETWLRSFGFKHMSSSEKQESMELNFVVFPGTTLLQKILKVDSQSSALEEYFRTYLNQTSGLSFENSLFTKDEDLEVEVDKDQIRAVKDLQNKIQRAVGVLCGSLKENQAKNIETHLLNQSSTSASMGCDAILHSSPLSENLQMDLSRGTQSAENSISKHDPSQTPIQVFSTVGRNKVKGKNTFSVISERSSAALNARLKNQNDDFFTSKVILTTTRSNRLVKSSRWVADALKELSRDNKNSRFGSCVLGISPAIDRKSSGSNFSELCSKMDDLGSAKKPKSVSKRMPSDAFKSQIATANGDFGARADVESKSSTNNEKAHPDNDKPKDGRFLGHVYVRTKKAMSKEACVSGENKLPQRTPDYIAKFCTSDKFLNSINLDAANCNDDAVATTCSSLTHLVSEKESREKVRDTGPSEEMTRQTKCDGGSEEHLPAKEMKQSIGLSSASDAEIQAAGIYIKNVAERLSVVTKFYNRRRKRDQIPNILDDLTGLPLFLERPLVHSV